MNQLLVFASMFAMAGLWVINCRVDKETSLLHVISAILMMIGAVTTLAWAIGSKMITNAWLSNGLSALLLGVALWFVFDRRHP